MFDKSGIFGSISMLDIGDDFAHDVVYPALLEGEAHQGR